MYLAELNIGRARGEADDPVMHGFTSRLDAINALADQSEGFIWRLQTDAGNATDIRPYEDKRILINLSVWASVKALRHFVYEASHGKMVRDGNEWFERSRAAQIVLWWIPEDHRPTLKEATERLERFRCHGPTPEAFDFAHLYPAPRD